MSFRANARGTGAVLIGLIAGNILTRISDEILLALGAYDYDQNAVSMRAMMIALSSLCVYRTLGGYLTAWIAPANRMAHAFTLGLLSTLFSLPNVFADELDVRREALIVAVTALPCALLGGYLYVRRRLKTS